MIRGWKLTQLHNPTAGSRVPGFQGFVPLFRADKKTAQHSKDPETETQTVTAVGQKYDLHVLWISKHPWDYNDISLESTRLVAAGLSLWLMILQAPIPPESIRDFHIFRTFHMRCFWYFWYQDGISDRQKITDWIPAELPEQSWTGANQNHCWVLIAVGKNCCEIIIKSLESSRWKSWIPSIPSIPKNSRGAPVAWCQCQPCMRKKARRSLSTTASSTNLPMAVDLFVWIDPKKWEASKKGWSVLLYHHPLS